MRATFEAWWGREWFVPLRRWFGRPWFLKAVPRPIFWMVVTAGLLSLYELSYWLLARTLNAGSTGVQVGLVKLPYVAALPAVTGYLALATTALAYAAYRQSLANQEQVSAAEKKRRADLRPHFDLQVTDGPNGPIVAGTFSLRPDRSAMWLRLRNLGPGNAANVKMAAYTWSVSTGAPNDRLTSLGRGGSPNQPIHEPQGLFPREVIGHAISLAVNENFIVPFQFRIPPLADYQGARPEPSTQYDEQIVWIVRGQDVEGQPVPELVFGVRLQVLSPDRSEQGQSLRNYLSIWRILRSNEATEIPIDRGFLFAVEG